MERINEAHIFAAYFRRHLIEVIACVRPSAARHKRLQSRSCKYQALRVVTRAPIISFSKQNKCNDFRIFASQVALSGIEMSVQTKSESAGKR